MREWLEGDPETLQLYHLADKHHWPMAVVEAMTCEEVALWLAYYDIKADRLKLKPAIEGE